MLPMKSTNGTDQTDLKKQFYETLMQASGHGILITDDDQTIVDANNTFCSSIGQDLKLVIGSHFGQGLEIFSGNASENWEKLQKALQSEQTASCIEIQITLNNESRFFNVNATRIKQTGKQKQGYIISAWRDVTELNQVGTEILQSESLQKTLLDNLPVIALILKKYSREIVAYNKLARDLGAVVGETCHESIILCEHHCPFCKAPDLWETNKSQITEAEYIGRSWEGRWIPFTDDLYIHYMSNITERKQSERKIQKYKDHLEKLVNERTIELEKKNKELERFNKLFVDREFRIKELREEVKELKQQLHAKL